MLEYEWSNPALMLLSYEPPAEAAPAHGQEPPHLPHHRMFPLYDRSSCLDLAGALFPSSPPPAAVTVPAPPLKEEYCSLHDYGVSLPQPPAGAVTRIGLDLGVRTYFSSSPDGELMQLGRNVYRRSGGNDVGGGIAGALFGGLVGGGGGAGSRARCQAEGCGADLTRGKQYHRRHKVCEFHSKATAVVVHGLTQRFCQQCSRFHVLSEFDQGKRSCRKRLADHNRRRRKTQPLPALLPLPPSPLGRDAAAACPNVAAAELSAKGASPGTCGRTPAAAASLETPASPTRMALGSCFPPLDGVVPRASSPSSSSSPSFCSSSGCCVLPHLADNLSYHRGVPMSIWDASAHDQHAH